MQDLTKIAITVGRIRLDRWCLLLPLAWIRGWTLLIILRLCQNLTGLWNLIMIVLLVESLRYKRSYLLINLLYWWNWLSLGLTSRTLLILQVVDHQHRCRWSNSWLSVLFGRWLLKLRIILVICTCTANSIVSRWSLVVASCWTITSFVITSTVETPVVQVGVLWLILCSLPVFSVSFASFVCPLVNTFMSFIWLLPALFLQRALCWDVAPGSTSGTVGLLRTVLLEMNWLFAPKTDLVHCWAVLHFLSICWLQDSRLLSIGHWILLCCCSWNGRLCRRVKRLSKWWWLPWLPDRLLLGPDPRLYKLQLTLLLMCSMWAWHRWL